MTALAERVGFEPTMAKKAITVFETVPFNHSGTSPGGKIITWGFDVETIGRAEVGRNPCGLRRESGGSSN
jgi:hypothetical protein